MPHLHSSNFGGSERKRAVSTEVKEVGNSSMQERVTCSRYRCSAFPKLAGFGTEVNSSQIVSTNSL